MILLTESVIAEACGATSALAHRWCAHLNNAISIFGISTKAQQAAFLAQLSVESARLSASVENLNYGATDLLRVFPREFSKLDALQYSHLPEKIANRAYANRGGNGGEISGDGWKYRGRGLIQISMKDNYGRIRDAIRNKIPLAPDFELQPEALALDQWGALSAGAFWTMRGCGKLADSGYFDDVTKAINGPGMQGKIARQLQHVKAVKALSAL